MCPCCGLVAPLCDGGVYVDAEACIIALRDFIAMEKWTAPTTQRKVRR